MSKKNYVKLNNNNRHLSLGNLFRILKEEANNKNFTIQSEIFCILFDIDSISDTTVNNYCTGVRAINSKYKSIYVNWRNKYKKDETIFKDIILNIIATIDSKNVFITRDYFNQSLDVINSNQKFNKVCLRLYNISKNDLEVTNEFSSLLKKLLDSKNLYKFFIEVLFFVILDKKQPVYIEDKFMDTLDDFLYSSEVSSDDAIDFVTVQLKGGLWSIRGIHELAKKGNPYACFEMGSLELYGQVAGYPRYQESFNFYKTAAQKNHPNAIWALGHLYYNGFVGSKSREDMKKAFRYFNKARKVNCIAAINSLGTVFKEGNIPFIQKDLKKAKKLFEFAANKNYIYAMNNLGNMYEEEGDFQKAILLYKSSASQGESWAANKLGEMYRIGIGTKKDLKKAFNYYNQATQATIYSVCFWAKYNLAHYFYENGVPEINIPKDINKSISLLEECTKHDIYKACEDLIVIYYNLYTETSDKSLLEKCEYYANLYLSKEDCDDKIIDKINKYLDNIYIKQKLKIIIKK